MALIVDSSYLLIASLHDFGMIYHRFLTAVLKYALVISSTTFLEYCFWFLSYYSVSTLNLKGLFHYSKDITLETSAL
jgi:hypothetical protein